MLRAYFPGSIETHSLVQNFYFGYDVNIADGFGVAQLTSNYIQANDIGLPSKRRAYTRGPDNRPILDMRGCN